MTDFLLDLDGTTCNIDHRLHYVKTKPKNFNAFEMGCSNDTPHEPVVLVAESLVAAGHRCIVMSGRSDKARERTVEWLAKHTKFEYAALLMRKHGDHRRDDVVKLELLDQAIELGFDPKFAFDDRNRVADAWVSRGIFVFNVNQHRVEF